MLSIVLVVATDPLLSRLFPGDFVKGHVPSNAALLASTGFFCSGVNPVRVGVRALCSQPASHACAVVLHHRRIDGRRSYDSQLEQGMAPLVLALVAADLASELLDRTASGRTSNASAVGGGGMAAGRAPPEVLQSW